MKLIAALIIVLVVAAGIIGPQALYVMDETQIAVVTRFGEPIRQVKKPGLYFKTPFVERVNYLDKRLLVFDAPPESLITKDKKRLIIDIYARGRIVDPLLFVETLRTESRAQSRAIDIVGSELRREIGLDNQSEIIRDNREEIMNRVKDAVEPKLAEFGIQIVDVRLKRADFPGEIANSVYERMKAERKRIADRERSAGAKADLEKRATVDRTAVEITSEAQRDADIIRGCGEAESIAIFASALELDPEFYTFQRSLETYRVNLTGNTMIVGSAQDLGQIFEEIRLAMADSAKAPAGAGDLAKGEEQLDDTRCLGIQAETAARQVLAGDLDTEPRAMILEKTEQMEWSDASLGCAQPGEEYVQVVTPGFRMAFSFEGETYAVHTNTDGSQVVHCELP
jgi:membrane protease subunit HflC